MKGKLGLLCLAFVIMCNSQVTDPIPKDFDWCDPDLCLSGKPEHIACKNDMVDILSLILSQQFMSNWSFSKTEIQEKLCKSSFPYDSTWMSPSNPRCSQRIQIQSCCGQGSIYMAKGCKNDNDGIWHNVGGRCIVKLYELRVCSWQMQVSLSLSNHSEQRLLTFFIRFQQKHR